MHTNKRFTFSFIMCTIIVDINDLRSTHSLSLPRLLWLLLYHSPVFTIFLSIVTISNHWLPLLLLLLLLLWLYFYCHVENCIYSILYMTVKWYKLYTISRHMLYMFDKNCRVLQGGKESFLKMMRLLGGKIHTRNYIARGLLVSKNSTIYATCKKD